MTDNLYIESAADLALRRQRQLRAGIVAGSIMIGSMALMAPFVVSKSPLPYMGTPKHKLRHALEYSMSIHRQRRGLGSHQSLASAPQTTISNQQPLVFVDLGSGDGEAVRQALLAGYDRAIGIELNTTLYLISQFRRLFLWSSRERTRSEFYCRDFFTYNLSHADTVMIFGVKPLMKRISLKLAKECLPETTILSYRFALPLQDAEDMSTQADLRLDASIVYDEQEMRIYKTTTGNEVKAS